MSFILIGLGKQRRNDLGETGTEQGCVWCSRTVYYHLVLVQTWLTCFFIPVFAYRNEYRVECPLCSEGVWIQREEVKAARLGELKVTGTFHTTTTDEQS